MFGNASSSRISISRLHQNRLEEDPLLSSLLTKLPERWKKHPESCPNYFKTRIEIYSDQEIQTLSITLEYNDLSFANLKQHKVPICVIISIAAVVQERSSRELDLKHVNDLGFVSSNPRDLQACQFRIGPTVFSKYQLVSCFYRQET